MVFQYNNIVKNAIITNNFISICIIAWPQATQLSVIDNNCEETTAVLPQQTQLATRRTLNTCDENK